MPGVDFWDVESDEKQKWKEATSADLVKEI
jgi:hypothetical protein